MYNTNAIIRKANFPSICNKKTLKKIFQQRSPVPRILYLTEDEVLHHSTDDDPLSTAGS